MRRISLEAETLAENTPLGFRVNLKVLPRIFAQINTIELILALLTIAIIYGFKRITTAIPSTLVALLTFRGAFALGVDYRPIAAIPSGLPSHNGDCLPDLVWTRLRNTSSLP